MKTVKYHLQRQTLFRDPQDFRPTDEMRQIYQGQIDDLTQCLSDSELTLMGDPELTT